VLLAAPTSAAELPALQAQPGVTAISGSVRDANGQPLEHVTLFDQGARVATDAQGRFLLAHAPTGPSVLTLDGRHTGPKRDQDYGTYQIQVKAIPGQTTILPFTSFLTRLDPSAQIEIPSPTTREVVITNRDLPGVELRIPPGVIIKDYENHPVTRVSLMVLGADRTPFPFPKHLDAVGRFVVQPSGACLETADGAPASAQIRYPNAYGQGPGARATLYHYDVHAGWTPYGGGTVNATGNQLVPDRDTVLQELDGECPPLQSAVELRRPVFQPNGVR